MNRTILHVENDRDYAKLIGELLKKKAITSYTLPVVEKDLNCSNTVHPTSYYLGS